jgi:hypothetical protein
VLQIWAEYTPAADDLALVILDRSMPPTVVTEMHPMTADEPQVPWLPDPPGRRIDGNSDHKILGGSERVEDLHEAEPSE